MSLESPDHNFSTLRRIFWPVKSTELRNFFCMAGLMFTVLFTQNILKILKDALLIIKTGVAVTDVIKMYAVIPTSAILAIIYAWLVDKFSFQKVFILFITIFIGYFVIFAFIIFPNINYFHHSDEYIAQVIQENPHFKWQLLGLYNWSYSIFYLLSELWPNIFFLTMFWQAANFLHNTEQAKRLYTLVSVFGNSASIMAGAVMLYSYQYGISYADLLGDFFPIESMLDNNDEVKLVQVVTIYMCIMSLLSIFFVSRLMGEKKMMSPKRKVKLGFMESLKYILNSSYIGYIFICSASFAFTMNMVEKTWKDQLKIFTNNNFDEYMIVMSQVILWSGVVMIIMNLIGNNSLRIFGWLPVALFTPIIMLVTGLIFFFVAIHEFIPPFLSYRFSSILSFAVLIGAIQNIITKGTKYAIWDTSKEMLYIPLDPELKVKGKVSVDLVSSKTGKLISSGIFLLIFHLFPTLTYVDCIPQTAVVFIVFCVLWLYGIKKLNGQYQTLLKKEQN